ncbi:MAG: hypothetical protein AB7D00_07250 [Rhodospirillaceae bacterium]
MLTALSLLLFAIAVPEREIALGLWRRWLGAEVGNRSIKVAVLIVHELWWLSWATQPLARWFAQGPLQALAGVAFMVAWCTALAVWFVYRHNNGGPEGTGGPARYGWAGYGYLWAWPLREHIGAWQVAGWRLVKPCGWTEVAEIYLGAMTGRLTGLALVGFKLLALALA